MQDLNQIKKAIVDSVQIKEQLLSNELLLQTILEVTNVCVAAFHTDGKVLWGGNGGSAADAQHLAAELSGRFYLDRAPLHAEALHVNPSYVTAVANDYSFEEVYARIVRAKGRAGDVLIALSTSGNSPNILKALEAAQALGMITVGLTGKTGGKMPPLCDYWLAIPAVDTPRIQEAHMLIGHIICAQVEARLFGSV